MSGENEELHAWLLGPPRLCHAGHELETPTRKSFALLCYLAALGRPAWRSDLALLLWGPQRMRNLRQAVYSLRRLPGADQWLHGGDPLTVVARTDLSQLEDAVRASAYEEALALARGPFLEGLHVPGDLPFHEWLAEQRTRAEALRREALSGSIRVLESERRYDEALERAEELLGLDGADELGHRAAMRISWLQGDRDRALARWAQCRTALARVGLEPARETTELVRAIEREEPGEWQSIVRQRAPLQVRRPARMVGRSREAARIEQAWKEGLAVVLTGPSGVGKTRLATEAARAHGAFLLLDGRPGEAEVPHATWSRLVERVLENAPRDALPRWVHRELAGLVPRLASEAGGWQEGPASRFDAAQSALFSLARRIWDVLVFDDVEQWDAASRTLLFRRVGEESLPDGQRGRCVLCVTETRTRDETADLVARLVASRLAARLALGNLDRRACTQLLRELRAGGLSEHSAALHELTAGNPLFLLETVRHILETTPAGARPVSPDDLPEGLVSLLASRVEVLPPLSRRLAQGLAVAGGDLDVEGMAEVLEEDAFAVAEAADELERAGLARGGRLFGGALRSAVLQSVTPAVRTVFHARIADALERRSATPDRIAHHRHEAGQAERAVPYVLEAGERALQAHADDDAAERFAQVQKLTTDLRKRLRAQLGLETVAWRRGDVEGAGRALSQALRTARSLQDDALLYEVLLRAARQEMDAGHPREALVSADEATDIARRLRSTPLVARALAQRGTALLRSGKLAEAREAFGAAAAADEQGVRTVGLWGLGALDGIGGRLESAHALHSEALTIARGRGDMERVLQLLNGLAATAERMAWYDESQRRFEECLALSRESGDVRTQAVALLNLAEIQMKSGRLGPAHRRATAGAALARELGSWRLEALAWTRLGTIQRVVGRAAAAERQFERAARAYEERGDRRNEVMIRFNLALARIQGGTEGADAEARGWLEALEREGLRDIAAWARLELAWLEDDPHAIRELAQEAAELGNPHRRLLAAMVEQKALLLEGCCDGPFPDLERAADELAVVESPLAHALLARVLSGPEAAERASRAVALCGEQARGLREPMRRSLRSGVEKLLTRRWPGGDQPAKKSGKTRA